ncbi:small-conductance mechanosensitive channel [Brevundimonas vesicularis]|uniref:mechanosensitive ion channel family protein n=1 Tax=Brevundimonas vesicularis TaxID=41276 RepID=UPI00277F2F73|nr:mechanosensitive ion channel domain-containing protein [Brevundimonas vesicularis]MDQ1191511.1 small-conductance mechanosensitive channel [Brevundimonas vesicularis]
MTNPIQKLGLDTIEQSQIARIAGINLTLGGLVSAGVILLIAFAAHWLVTRSLRRVRERSDRSRQAIYLLERLAGYGIIVVGIMSALSAAGLNLSSLTVFAGALGIGVGLGLQGVVKEFVSGLFLIFDRMVSVGDYIEIEDIGIRGAIMEIGPRATRVRTNDNVNVLVPNSRFIEQPVTNWTMKGDTRRIHVPFTVAYGSDRGKVRDAVLAAARASPFTLPETEARKSQVWLVAFGDRGLSFELVVWPTRDAVKRPAAMHAAYTWLIADALDAAGVEVPVPQTDLRLRTAFGLDGEEALKRLGYGVGSPPRPTGPQSTARTANDAADDVMADDEAEIPEPPAPPKARQTD